MCSPKSHWNLLLLHERKDDGSANHPCICKAVFHSAVFIDSSTGPDAVALTTAPDARSVPAYESNAVCLCPYGRQPSGALQQSAIRCSWKHLLRCAENESSCGLRALDRGHHLRKRPAAPQAH